MIFEQKQQKIKSTTLIFCGLLCAAVLFSAGTDAANVRQTEEKPFQAEQRLETITVLGESESAPTSPVLSPFGVQYNTINEQNIRDQNSMDFVSAMRNIPGVIFQSKNAVGSQTSHSLYVRGRGASHPSPDLAIQFDGVPRSGALYGQTLGDSIAVGTIGGMEIYKSPQPVRFGSGYALVDVMPKRMMSDGMEGHLGLRAGTYATFVEDAAAGYKNQHFDIYAAQNWTSSNGHRAHSRAQQENYYVNVGYALNDRWDVRFLANAVSAQTLAPGPNEKPSSDNGISWPMAERFDTRTSFSTLTLNHHYTNAEGYLKAYWDDTKFDLLQELNNGVRYDDGGRWSRQHVKLYGLRGKETIHPWQQGEIMIGFDLDKTDFTNKQHTYATGATTLWDFPDTTMFSPYIGFNQTWGSADTWHITPSVGFRYYRHDEFANKSSPQAGLVLGYDQTDININYSRGVNYPSPVVLQGLFGVNGLDNPQQFWQDLKPEVVDHYEFGVNHAWEDKANISATAFYDKGRDRFRVYFGGPTPASYNDPIGRYRIRGLELASSVKPLANLELFAGATWLDASAKGRNGVYRDAMPYTPDFTLQAGVHWNYDERYFVYVDMQHIRGLYQGTSMRTTGFDYGELSGKDKLDNITLFNARLSHKIKNPGWQVDEMEIFLAVDNLFDQDYEYAKGYPMPGITAMAGINIDF
jgi:Outer membrane receptor proteins, mostly Fe transport